MHPGRLIIEINVKNDISDDFYFDYKAVQSNLTKKIISNLRHKLKIMIFNIMTIRKKTGLVPPTLHYCGHNAKKIGTKKMFVENFHAAYSKWPLIRCTNTVAALKHNAVPWFQFPCFF